MAKKQKNHNPFQGLWVVARSQQQNHKNKWLTQKRYRFGDYTLDFRQISASGFILGEMRETMAGSVSDHDYFYSPNNARIYITRRGARLFASGDTDIYRVRNIRGSMVLYCVTELDDKLYDIPDECWFRLILKRNTPKNRLAGWFGLRRRFSAGTP